MSTQPSLEFGKATLEPKPPFGQEQLDDFDDLVDAVKALRLNHEATRYLVSEEAAELLCTDWLTRISQAMSDAWCELEKSEEEARYLEDEKHDLETRLNNIREALEE